MNEEQIKLLKIAQEAQSLEQCAENAAEAANTLCREANEVAHSAASRARQAWNNFDNALGRKSDFSMKPPAHR